MGIYRRKGSHLWWSRVSVGGRTLRESTGTADKIQAQEWCDRRRAELWRQVQFGERPVYRWEEAVLRWLEESRAKRDWSGDRQRLALLHPDLEGLPLSTVTGNRLSEILARFPQLKTPGARNRYRATVRAILRKAEREWEWIERAPNIRLEREATDAGRWITREEAGRLIGAAPDHLSPVIRMALATGLRKSNLLGLRWDHVDLGRRQLWVDGSASKSGKPIGLPLNALAISVLAECRGKHPVAVFTVDGRPYKWIDHRTWLRVCRDARLEGLRFHDLRHTWASWLAQSGVDPQRIKRLGGWSTMAMVERYAHLGVDHLRDAAERIPSTFSAQPDVLEFPVGRKGCASR